ncbi:MAG: universal stress protein [Alphaproteobacteria bacterium]|nr:universal stress protein [Alphaproteobacteria bacterium]
MTDYRILLAVVGDADSGRPPLDVALSMAKTFGAHVAALHVRGDPTGAVPLVGEGISGSMVEEMIDAAERQIAERATNARRAFDQAVAAAGVPLSDRPATTGPSAAWIERTGREEDITAQLGRLVDLIVVGQPRADQDLPSMMTLNAALMESGRPILMVPRGAVAPRRSVAVAWNGSTESAGALHAALPMMVAAQSITILSAHEDGAMPGLSADEARIALEWRGIRATCRALPGGGHVGATLLAEAAAAGADLLVMGAYTHSRLRQLILGGVTRHVLDQATLPVLMNH